MTIYRILLDDKEIIPIDIGTHDRVYWIWMELDEFLERGKFKIQDATPIHRALVTRNVADFKAEALGILNPWEEKG